MRVLKSISWENRFKDIKERFTNHKNTIQFYTTILIREDTSHIKRCVPDHDEVSELLRSTADEFTRKFQNLYTTEMIQLQGILEGLDARVSNIQTNLADILSVLDSKYLPIHHQASIFND